MCQQRASSARVPPPQPPACPTNQFGVSATSFIIITSQHPSAAIKVQASESSKVKKNPQSSNSIPRDRVVTWRNLLRGATGGRYDDSTSVRVLYDVGLALLWRAREPEAGLPALAQRFALLGGHWPVLLEVRTETPAAPVGAAVRVTGSGVGRRTIARGRRVVRSRGRCSRTSFEDAAAKECLALTVLPHAAVPTQGRGAKSRVTRYGARRGWLIAVWCDLGTREVRVAGVSNYSIGIKVTVELVWTAAISAPEK